jgi:hypothetical protein
MSGRKTTLVVSLLLVAALSACNLPSEQGTPTPDPILTVTALAQALATPTPPPVLDTPTPEFSPTPAFTPTPSVPTVTVSVDTNCRTGPSTQYDRIGGLLVGQSAEVVGKNTATNYWIIRTPGGSGTCWLWGQYATVSGNTANLPEYPVPPTPTPKATDTPTATSTPSNTPTATNTPAFAVTSITYSIGTWSQVPSFINCPRVTASITTNGAGTVTFKWTRQDVPGGGATQTLNFAAAGTQSVNYDWARGSTWAGTATWVGIFVVSPNNQDFGKIDFSTACTFP